MRQNSLERNKTHLEGIDTQKKNSNKQKPKQNPKTTEIQTTKQKQVKILVV